MPLIATDGKPVVIPEAVAHRARDRFNLTAEGCHISTYSTGGSGYAQIGWWAGGKSHMVTAHRAAWTAVHGQIPLAMTVDHVCRVIRCVNVDHLRLLTNIENAADNRIARSWAAGINPFKTDGAA